MSLAPTYYAKGQWKACCWVCGKIFKSSQLVRRWDGPYVCLETCFELRNAQELIRPPRPERPIPWSQSCEGEGGCANVRAPRTRVLDSKLDDRISSD